MYNFIFFSLNLFIFFLAAWAFVAMHGLSLVAERGVTLRCSARASRCGAQALGAWASVVVAGELSSCGSQALERRLSSCGARV